MQIKGLSHRMDDNISRSTFPATDEEQVFSKSLGGCNAKDARLKEQTRPQAFYTAMGAAIIKGLDKPIVEVRPVFHRL